MGHSFYACSHRTKHREATHSELPKDTALSPPPLRPIQHSTPNEAFAQHSEQVRHKTASTATTRTKRSPQHSEQVQYKTATTTTARTKRSPSPRNKCNHPKAPQSDPPLTKERPPCISKADTTTRSNIRRTSTPKTPAPEVTFAEEYPSVSKGIFRRVRRKRAAEVNIRHKVHKAKGIRKGSGIR